MLEKYKTLARDATQAGDRITAEYYYQYADHYFRVLNENRPRFDERQQRPQQNWQDQRDGEPEGLDDEEDGASEAPRNRDVSPERANAYGGDARDPDDPRRGDRNINRGQRDERNVRRERDDREYGARDDRDYRPARDDHDQRTVRGPTGEQAGRREQARPVQDTSERALRVEGESRLARDGGDDPSFGRDDDGRDRARNERQSRAQRTPAPAPDSFTREPSSVTGAQLPGQDMASEQPRARRGRPRREDAPVADAGDPFAVRRSPARRPRVDAEPAAESEPRGGQSIEGSDAPAPKRRRRTASSEPASDATAGPENS